MKQNKIEKCWLSFDEQLALLQKRGLIITDEDEAKRILKAIGYERLKGYAYLFRKLKSDKGSRPYSWREDDFYNNIYFEDIIALYKFDNRLKEHCFRAIKKIEIQIKVALAYTLGRHDSLAYDLGKNFIKDTPKAFKNHQFWHNKLEEKINNSRDDCVLHYRKNKKEKLPIWCILDLLDMGMLVHFYKNLKPEYVAESLNFLNLSIGIKRYIDMLQAFNILRNKCAHHSQVFNKTHLDKFYSPFHPKEEGIDRGRIFTILCCLNYCMKKFFNENKWEKNVIQLLQDFPKKEIEGKNNSITLTHTLKANRNWQKSFTYI